MCFSKKVLLHDEHIFFFVNGEKNHLFYIYLADNATHPRVPYPKEIRNPTFDLILALSTLTSDSDTSSLSGYGTETSDSSTDTDIDTIVNEYR